MEQTAAMSDGNRELWPRQIGPTSAWWLHHMLVDAVFATLEEKRTVVGRACLACEDSEYSHDSNSIS